VNAAPALVQRAAAQTQVGRAFPSQSSKLLALFRSLRPHQWVKNLIIFVPLLTSHQITNWPLFLAALWAFVAFCLCASGVYVLNDLMDLDADRHHPTKRTRPFAAGDLPLPVGLVLVPLLLVLSGVISLQLSG